MKNAENIFQGDLKIRGAGKNIIRLVGSLDFSKFAKIKLPFPYSNRLEDNSDNIVTVIAKFKNEKIITRELMKLAKKYELEFNLICYNLHTEESAEVLIYKKCLHCVNEQGNYWEYDVKWSNVEYNDFLWECPCIMSNGEF